MKIVINKSFLGFKLTALAIKEFLSLKGEESFFYEDNFDKDKDCLTYIKNVDDVDNNHVFYVFTKFHGDEILGDITNIDEDTGFYDWSIDRTDVDLIKVIESLGEKANSISSKLKIVEIPDNIEYYIQNIEGYETIHETHRFWN